MTKYSQVPTQINSPRMNPKYCPLVLTYKIHRGKGLEGGDLAKKVPRIINHTKWLTGHNGKSPSMEIFD